MTQRERKVANIPPPFVRREDRGRFVELEDEEE